MKQRYGLPYFAVLDIFLDVLGLSLELKYLEGAGFGECDLTVDFKMLVSDFD